MPAGPTGHPADVAARAFMDALAAGVEPLEATCKLLARALHPVVESVHRDVSPEDVAQEALAKFVVVHRDGASEIGNPWGFLRKIAHNLAIDESRRLQRRRKEVPLDMQADIVEADDVARMLDEHATIADVERALAEHAAAGDETVTRVVTAWLDLAERHGEPPALRAVGEVVHLSHTAVRKTLEKFGKTLARHNVSKESL